MNTSNIYNSVERLSELLKVSARQAGAIYGLQPVQLEILHYLSQCNQFSDTPMAVTEYLGQTKGTVSQTLKVLETKALITKHADENDKRTAHLKVTAKGKQLLQTTIPTEMFVNACEVLSEQQQIEIEQGLHTLITGLIKTNNMKSFGICSSCRYNSKLSDGTYFCNLVKQPLENTDIQLICREHEVENKEPT